MEIERYNPNYVFGPHIGKEKTLQQSVERWLDEPMRCMQIFVAGRTYAIPSVAASDLVATKNLLDAFDRRLYIHGCLIYNICGSPTLQADPQYHKKLNGTLNGITKELDIGAAMDVGVVIHTGTCKDKTKGLQEAIKNVIQALTAETPHTLALAKELGVGAADLMARRHIILENSAGEGTKLGSTMDEMDILVNGVKACGRGKTSMCIDTCHIYAAGQVDFGDIDHVQKFFQRNTSSIELYHLNDSLGDFGCKADRHGILGQNKIWGDPKSHDAFRLFMAKTKRVPLVLETRSGDWIGEDLAFMQAMVPEISARR